MGFNFDTSDNSFTSSPNNSFCQYTYWTDPSGGIDLSGIAIQSCESSVGHRSLDKQPIYLELKKWSIFDELNPFPRNSNTLFPFPEKTDNLRKNCRNICDKYSVNASNSSINTAILKIPPKTLKYYSEAFDENNAILFFDPPLERVSTFGFKFRYHDGRLVDLNYQDVNFTIEINQLRNEIPRQMTVRTNSTLS